jgi:methylmalonyl-CoA mutase N-terminal domain/subunit
MQAISSGVVQKKLAAQAYEYEKKLRSGELPKVGVNRSVETGSSAQKTEWMQIYQVDSEEMELQRKRLRSIRADRSNETVEAALAEVSRVCERGGTNVMPAVTNAVRALATAVEITAAMKKVYGTFREPRF